MVFVAGFFAKRVAILITIVAFVTGLTFAFYAAVDALASTVSASLPGSAYTLVTAFLPDQMTAMLSIIVSVKLTKLAFDAKVTFAEYLRG